MGLLDRLRAAGAAKAAEEAARAGFVAPTGEPRPREGVRVRALTGEEVAAFWGGAPLRLYTNRYLEEFCRVNGLTLVTMEDEV